MVKIKNKKIEEKTMEEDKHTNDKSPSTVELKADLDEFTREFELGKIDDTREQREKSESKKVVDKYKISKDDKYKKENIFIDQDLDTLKDKEMPNEKNIFNNVDVQKEKEDLNKKEKPIHLDKQMDNEMLNETTFSNEEELLTNELNWKEKGGYNKKNKPKSKFSISNKETRQKSNNLSSLKLRMKEDEIRNQTEKIIKLKEKIRKYDKALRAITVERSSLIKEIKNLKKQLVEVKVAANEVDKDKENLSQRWENEKKEIINYRAKDFLLNILPTIDMFESALSSKDVSEETKAWLTGFEMIFKNFMTVLEEEGVRLIDVKPKDLFNHEIHHAIESKQDNSKPDGTILEVKQKGYILKDKLLRPAMVVVSKIDEETKEIKDVDKPKKEDEQKKENLSENKIDKKEDDKEVYN